MQPANMLNQISPADNRERSRPFAASPQGLATCFGDNFLAPNYFITSGSAHGNDDLDRAFQYSLYEVPYLREQVMMKVSGKTLVASFQINLPELDKNLVDRVLRDIKNLPGSRYEIWHREHNVSDDVHIGDPFGNATELLDLLRSRVPVIQPPVNHNKVSSKPESRFGCNHMHLDSFEGMRRAADGSRLGIERYFFNLDLRERDILIAAFSPDVVDQLVPIDYQPNLLVPLFEAHEFNIPLLRFKTPAADLKAGRIYGLKLLTTHAIHGEFGPEGDLLAIVNTLPA